MPPQDEERETGRLEAFSDGVFGFAITILVLDLKVPRAGEDVAAHLRGEIPAFASIGLTFATLYVLWTNHHALLRRVHHVDGALLFANGFVLLLVSVAAFPTAILAEFLLQPEARLAAAFYATWLLLVNVSFNGLVTALGRARHRSDHGLHDAELRGLKRRMRWGFVAYVVALAAAVWSSWITVAICMGSWMYWMTRAVVGHRPQAAT